VIFCGLPKCGKTTLGKKAAKKLNWEFIDTDRLIENAYPSRGWTCREIHQHEGAAVFRRLEKEQIASLEKVDRTVIALGGGSLDNQESAILLRKLGTLIYLKEPPERIWNRIKDKPPAYLDPLDLEKDFYKIASLRMVVYEKTAHFTIDKERKRWDTILLELFSSLDSYVQNA
jgi:shikimate kinase